MSEAPSPPSRSPSPKKKTVPDLVKKVATSVVTATAGKMTTVAVEKAAEASGIV